MFQALNLTDSQLVDIARAFSEKVKAGLQADNQEIGCLPTFVPAKKGAVEGEAYVLDLGGSNIRAGRVSVENNIVTVVCRSETLQMPWKRGDPFDKMRFLEVQAGILETIATGAALPLGYCFSYPTRSQKNGDAALIRWTKDVNVPGMIGNKVGETLLNFLNLHQRAVRCSRVAVINDTVASLFSGLTRSVGCIPVGLIVGTGFNIASLFPRQSISKLRSPFSDIDEIPVNLEAGAFVSPHMTGWDRAVNGQGNQNRDHIIEQAVSGAYLGRLLKTAYPDVPVDPERGALALTEILMNADPDLDRYRAGARAIYRRSAELVAACLAGLIHRFAEFGMLEPDSRLTEIMICAEGSLFWSSIPGEGAYNSMVSATLQRLLRQLQLSGCQIRFEKVNDATLVGSALAALSLDT